MMLGSPARSGPIALSRLVDLVDLAPPAHETRTIPSPHPHSIVPARQLLAGAVRIAPATCATGTINTITTVNTVTARSSYQSR